MISGKTEKALAFAAEEVSSSAPGHMEIIRGQGQANLGNHYRSPGWITNKICYTMSVSLNEDVDENNDDVTDQLPT